MCSMGDTKLRVCDHHAGIGNIDTDTIPDVGRTIHLIIKFVV